MPNLAQYLLVASIAVATNLDAATLSAVEYHHAVFDHYFITADPVEIDALDSGRFSGWRRTGQTLPVLSPDDGTSGSIAVCRFYGRPEKGLDSHFYSATPAECAAVQAQFSDSWLLESDAVFRLRPVDSSGTCPAGWGRVYRTYNNRPDINHRYTLDAAIQAQMVAQGHVAEGLGSPPAVWCAPVAGAVEAPTCAVTASNATPTVGSNITLSANCSGAPTSYAWTGCASAGSSCVATSATPGSRSYTVTASNAGGTSTPASVIVNWQAPANPPSCTLSASSTSPTVNNNITLTANCTNNPTRYTWTNCSSTGPTCVATSPSPGVVVYSVAAGNAAGTGVPASANVSWQAAGGGSWNGSCPGFGKTLVLPLQWSSTVGNVTATTATYGMFTPGTAVVSSFTTPAASANGQLGIITVYEYGGAPAVKTTTLSTQPCDFGPGLAQGSGFSAPIYFSVGTNTFGYAQLLPSTTYYFNVVNQQNGVETCGSECASRVELKKPKGL